MGLFDSSATLSIANAGITSKVTTLGAAVVGGIIGCV
jgi:hypothetical protein